MKLPKYIEDFEREKECSFVSLQGWDDHKTFVKPGCVVNQQGLMYKRHFMPWNDIASIKIKKAKIIIMPRKGSSSTRISFSIYQIANTGVLVELVFYILKQRDRGPDILQGV